MKIIAVDRISDIELPANLRACPYCGAPLYIAEIKEGMEETLDGEIVTLATDIALECSGEPDIDGEEYDDWVSWHSDMPYVNWLPAEVAVASWLKENYRFVEVESEEETRRKLERWVKGCGL